MIWPDSWSSFKKFIQDFLCGIVCVWDLNNDVKESFLFRHNDSDMIDLTWSVGVKIWRKRAKNHWMNWQMMKVKIWKGKIIIKALWPHSLFSLSLFSSHLIHYALHIKLIKSLPAYWTLWWVYGTILERKIAACFAFYFFKFIFYSLSRSSSSRFFFLFPQPMTNSIIFQVMWAREREREKKYVFSH